MDKAAALLADTCAAGISPDKVTRSKLGKGYRFSGDIDAAFAVLTETRDAAGSSATPSARAG